MRDAGGFTQAGCAPCGFALHTRRPGCARSNQARLPPAAAAAAAAHAAPKQRAQPLRAPRRPRGLEGSRETLPPFPTPVEWRPPPLPPPSHLGYLRDRGLLLHALPLGRGHAPVNLLLWALVGAGPHGAGHQLTRGFGGKAAPRRRWLKWGSRCVVRAGRSGAVGALHSRAAQPWGAAPAPLQPLLGVWSGHGISSGVHHPSDEACTRTPRRAPPLTSSELPYPSYTTTKLPPSVTDSTFAGYHCPSVA